MTGAAQKWASAVITYAKVWQVSVAWKSLSAHDFTLKSSAQMARPDFMVVVGGGCSCILLLHPVPTSADAGLGPCACGASLLSTGANIPLAQVATCAGGAFSFSH